MPLRREDVATTAAIPPRGWPVALVAMVVASALSLTGFLFVLDRQNALAATGSRANSARDALALASLERFSRAMDQAASIRRADVVGLEAIGVREFQSRLVAPMGGVLELGPHEWTLALDGGWACLLWLGGRSAEGMATATLGVCGDDAPLVGSPAVTPSQFRSGEASAVSAQVAAVYAAKVAARVSSPRTGPRLSLVELDVAFTRLRSARFRSWATPSGISVVTTGSSACVRPTATRAQVTLGVCA